MSDSIKVVIKVRPLIKREKDDNSAIQWIVQDNSIVSTNEEVKKRGDGRFYFGMYILLTKFIITMTFLCNC